FFFQAEDGIRDKLVTGVQTCALPILLVRCQERVISPSESKKEKNAQCRDERKIERRCGPRKQSSTPRKFCSCESKMGEVFCFARSEERRVGKECRFGRWGGQ